MIKSKEAKFISQASKRAQESESEVDIKAQVDTVVKSGKKKKGKACIITRTI